MYIYRVAGPGKAKKEFACKRGRGLEKFVLASGKGRGRRVLKKNILANFMS